MCSLLIIELKDLFSKIVAKSEVVVLNNWTRPPGWTWFDINQSLEQSYPT